MAELKGRQSAQEIPATALLLSHLLTPGREMKTLHLHSTAQHTEAHTPVGDAHADSVHQIRELT